MVPAAVVDPSLDTLVPLLRAGDIVIDGGNSYYIDDIRRAEQLREKGMHYVDVGVSGGVWGLDRGYCLMIGGEDASSAPRPDLPGAGPGHGHRPAPRDATRSAARRNRAICTAARTAPATLSRWCTMASSTA